MLTINAYCRDWGWLFNDLKASLAAVVDPDARVVPSLDPLPDADAYIAIRTDEALDSPAPGRTIVQWHDYREHRAVWRRIGEFAALQTVDEEQTIPGVETHCRPIGARSFFTIREGLPERFTLGWVGRDVIYQGRHVKRPQLFVELIQDLQRWGVDVQAHFYGPGFGPGNITEYAQAVDGTLFTGNRGRNMVNFYHGLDALVVTCEPEPGPLPIFEALRCGVPVITTQTGAARHARYGVLVREHDELAKTARHLYQNRGFYRPADIAREHPDLTQERWAQFSVDLAALACHVPKLTS